MYAQVQSWMTKAWRQPAAETDSDTTVKDSSSGYLDDVTESDDSDGTALPTPAVARLAADEFLPRKTKVCRKQNPKAGTIQNVSFQIQTCMIIQFFHAVIQVS